jgi:shikimate kinase/3-dehydroquinate synthase
MAALRLSEQGELRAQVGELLAGAGLPTSIDGVDPDAVIEATTRDKKRTGEKVPFVLVREPGDVVFGQEIDDSALSAAVKEIIAA